MSNVIFPIFEQSATFTNDSFWKEILNECSKGKFPRYSSYNSNEHTITIHSDSGKSIFDLPQNPQELTNRVIQIYRDRENGIQSNDDISKSKRKAKAQKNENSINMNCGWKNIRQKSARDTLIFNYAYKLKEKYKLDDKQFKKFLALLSLGFQYKQLSSDDIIYSHGRIKKIKNIKYSKKTGFILTRKPKIAKSALDKQKDHPFIATFIRYYNRTKNIDYYGENL